MEEKKPFSLPFPLLTSTFVQEPNWLIFISLIPQLHGNEPTLRVFPEKCRPFSFYFFIRIENNIVFGPTGWVGGRKNQFLSPVTMTCYIWLIAAQIFPGFPGKFVWIFPSSFHVCRLCSPFQIKYVSFADRKKSIQLLKL